MNVTFHHPGNLSVFPDHTLSGGRVMVYIDEGKETLVGLFWVTPETAAQWIEALTPLAAQAKP